MWRTFIYQVLWGCQLKIFSHFYSISASFSSLKDSLQNSPHSKGFLCTRIGKKTQPCLPNTAPQKEKKLYNLHSPPAQVLQWPVNIGQVVLMLNAQILMCPYLADFCVFIKCLPIISGSPQRDIRCTNQRSPLPQSVGCLCPLISYFTGSPALLLTSHSDSLL